MSILKLPLEIMYLVANLLAPRYKLECVRVCILWRVVFEDSLWETIIINSPDDLKGVCNAVTTRTNRYNKAGNRTRRLYMGDSISAENNQLYSLQKSFPNLKYLIISRNSLRNEHNIAKRGWSFWRELTHLKLFMNESGTQNQIQKLHRLSLYLPNIKNLECFSTIKSRAPTYTLEDFEALHSNMPALEYLCLPANVAILSDRDIELIFSTKPAKSTTGIKFQITTIDIRWLCYFAKKYPNLSTFEWIEVEPFYRHYVFETEAAQILSKLPCAFTHVNKVHIRSSPKSEKVVSILYRALRQNKLLAKIE
ncbi:hypothetical protein J3Q64DRAFT_1861373 [Phycomyces blakesleeanus]|uniref:F-box domain-containing protein n=2 Tax=Phycomyces blakesleeanus TaxID=4837 RepID=A0A162U847_PHYB8|nr:hypothetical protein PHYBLDRAFT_167646 [Phycomyces blakesleeanus NRRL 1555(-)]OAD74222.1 hypothetical protein PHYBLDRAFT_167646 [Phycomyces blakesleeanus NRRL 1555(-)]|eukprot:XP_018292262.1 hypothetical protein PHYBLDRAFT_167646 [Phycomyces blakesleeanus NRRL 1555(-)]